MKLTGAQIVTEVLCEQGVDTIFGYPGGAVLNIYDALYEYKDKIRHILTAHEQGASHAADGYARASGKTGVVIATSGPGATNLVTGIATAYMDSIPMVAITANVAQELIGKDSFQEVYIAGITMPITKHNFVVRNVKDLADTLRKAFRIANSDRPGPVLVDIPKDVTAAKCEFEPMAAAPIIDKENDISDVDLKMVAKVINSAKRPVIYYGGGVIASGAADILNEFIHKAQIPACYTMMATGVLGYYDSLNMGLVGMHGTVTSSKAVDSADVLIAIGARFSDRVATKKGYFAPKAKIIQIDIDAAEINKNVNPDISMVGDMKEVLRRLTPLVSDEDRTQWVSDIRRWKGKLEYTPVSNDSIIRPHQAIETIYNVVGEDVIVATDVGQHQMWALQYGKHTAPRKLITSGGLGTMGFGYGAAIGSKFAKPDMPVVHVTGDGSFHMNLNEVCTAVSYDVPIITVVLNNSVLGMVRQWQTIFYDKRYSSTTLERKTDYVKLADAFGAKGFRCTTIGEFETALKEAVALNTTCIIECVIDRDERVIPMIPSGGTVQDVITE